MNLRVFLLSGLALAPAALTAQLPRAIFTESPGNRHVTLTHRATDHSWSDQRIELEANVIRWLRLLFHYGASGAA